MGITARLKEAKAAGGNRVYFGEGQHIARVDAVKFDETRKHVEMFASEFTIMATDSKAPGMQPGSRVDYACLTTNDMYDSNIKSFMMALLRMNEMEFNATDEKGLDKMIKDATEKEQKYCGRCVEVSCVAGEDGRIFPRFTKINAQDEALVLKQYAAQKAAAAGNGAATAA